MTYASFNYQKPDPDTDKGTVAFTNTRNNLLALRDMIVSGAAFGWQMNMYNAAGNGPPPRDYAPDIIVWKHGAERIKEVYTWAGAQYDIPTKTVYAYSSDSGSTYETIATATYTTTGGAITAINWA